MVRSISIFLPIGVFVFISNIFEMTIVTSSVSDSLMGNTQHGNNMTLRSPRHHIPVDLRVNNAYYKVWMMKVILSFVESLLLVFW